MKTLTRLPAKAMSVSLCYLIVFLVMIVVLSDNAAAVSGYSPLPYSGVQSQDLNPIDTEEYLQEFHQDPMKVMNTPLARTDQNGKIVIAPVSPFDLSGIPAEEMLAARDQTRAIICRASGVDCREDRVKKPGRWAGYDERNHITRILPESEVIRNLLTMEKENLIVGKLAEKPWTDSYWPMNRGLTGRRWNDSGFPDSLDWLENRTYVLENSGWLTSLDKFSPAEKYDLLVGDSNKSLTESSWRKGQFYYERDGKVAGWQGLCHGWAPAAIMAPNPKQSVKVQAPNGAVINFYPSDIKALASLSWGEALPSINSLGQRCNVKNPKVDEYGRVTETHCFDINPGAWHMAIVSHLGRQKRGFVFDSTYDHQVWNYPVYAYSYRYFNPQTLASSPRMAGAMVRKEDFAIDKFKAHRSPTGTYVVGISMDVQYASPSAPNTEPEFNSLLHTIKYVYDLEIDDHGNIVGGEWYSNFHPDFIWSVPVGSKPLAEIEKQTPGLIWNGDGPVPPNVREAAYQASQKQQSLNVIVETLLRLSQGSAPENPPEPVPGPIPGPVSGPVPGTTEGL